MARINSIERKQLNKAICNIVRAYSLSEALLQIENRLNESNISINDSLIFLSESGNAFLDLNRVVGENEERIENSGLFFSWYKLSTCYEIVAYLS